MRCARSTTVPAVLSALAVLATLLAPCVCLPQAPAADAHACCAPPAGYRSAASGCCPDLGEAGGAAGAVPSPPYSVAELSPAAGVAALPAAAAAVPSPSRPAPEVSPPLTVRRL
jgi:hypothetical protein